MARSFNGTSDRITADAAAGFTQQAAYSVGGWVIGPQQPATPAEREFFAEARSTDHECFVISNDLSGFSKKAKILSRNGGGAATLAVSTAAAVLDNTWHHILFTQDATSAYQVYVDGAPDATAGGTYGRNTTVTDWLTLGALRWQGTQLDFFNGSLSRWAKWNRQLSADEAKALGAGWSPLMFQPVHYWPLTGQDSPEPDLGSSPVNGTLTGTASASDPALLAMESIAVML